MRIEDKEPLKWLALSVILLAVLGSLAWFGINRLEALNEAGKFQFLWGAVGEKNWPTLFSFLKLFLKIFIGVVCFGVMINIVWIIVYVSRVFRQLVSDTGGKLD